MAASAAIQKGGPDLHFGFDGVALMPDGPPGIIDGEGLIEGKGIIAPGGTPRTMFDAPQRVFDNDLMTSGNVMFGGGETRIIAGNDNTTSVISTPADLRLTGNLRLDNLLVTSGSTASTTNTIYIRDQTINGPYRINTSTGSSNTVWRFHNVMINGPVIQSTINTATTGWVWTPETEAQKARARLRNQMQPDLTEMFGHQIRATKGQADFRNSRANELLALQLLRQMVTSEVFRKYLRYGFVTVRGPSGLTYVIDRSSYFIRVMDSGEMIANLCVVLRDNSIPPTDGVVAKMLICECDEADIWERANVRWASQEARQHPAIVATGVQDQGYGRENRIEFMSYPRQNGGNGGEELNFGGGNTVNIFTTNFAVQAA